MIWSDTDIRNGLKTGQIYISDLKEEHIQPASVDVTLSNKFTRYRTTTFWEWFTQPFQVIDPKNDVTPFTESLTADSYVLAPGEFILGAVEQYLSLSDGVVARVEGKSSIGRLGITVHSTAGYVDPGFTGYITLEIFNQGSWPVRLHAGMCIAQFAFSSLQTPCTNLYNGRYTDQYSPAPVVSRVHQKL